MADDEKRKRQKREWWHRNKHRYNTGKDTAKDKIRCPMCGMLRGEGSAWFQVQHKFEWIRQWFCGKSDIRTEKFPLPNEWLDFFKDACRSLLERITGERWYLESDVKEMLDNDVILADVVDYVEGVDVESYDDNSETDVVDIVEPRKVI